MNLYLIRHPRPDIGAGVCYGSIDLDLVPDWEPDAEALSNWLFPRLKTGCKSYHSPLKRAAQLAQFLIPDSQEIHSLSELDFGDWEGLKWNEIPKEEIDLWAQDIAYANPYQGESLNSVKERVMGWWNGIVETWSEEESFPEDVIIVAHSGVIKVLVSQLCGWPLEGSHCIHPDFLTITELSIAFNTTKDAAKQTVAPFVSLKRLGAGDWL